MYDSAIRHDAAGGTAGIMLRDVINGHRWARIGTGRYVTYTHLRRV